MLRIPIAIFIVLHGLVHLLYYGQSRRMFELQPGMLWPDGSWAFTRLLGEGATRSLAGAACLLAALGLILGGVGVLLRQGWARPLVIGAAALSAVMYILLWDGTLRRLHDQGAIGVLISLAIAAAVVLALPHVDPAF